MSQHGRSRGARWALVGVLAYLIGVVLAATFVRYTLWSERDLAAQLPDATWQLELAWRAGRGVWSGRDFVYTMGPLLQALLWLSTPDPTDAQKTLVGMQLTFALLCLGLACLMAWRSVRRSWTRVGLLLVWALLGFGAGPSTLRALVSTLIVLSYALAADGSQRRRGGWWPAAAVLLALALSVDRFALGVASILTMAATEALVRWRRGESPAVAVRRFGQFSLALGLGLASLAALAFAFGANPARMLAEQNAIVADYGAAVKSVWRLDVRRDTILMFVAACAVLGLVIPFGRRTRIAGCLLIAGALPSTAFAMVQPDDGHVYLALLPVVMVLVLIALDGSGRESPALSGRGPRVAAGLLAYTFIAGWFATHPDARWWSPRFFGDAWAAIHAKKVGQTNYATDIGQAMRWLRARPTDACLAVSPPLAALHPLTNRSGPTELPLVWSFARDLARARAIESARCPDYIHFLASYDTPTSPWILRHELLTVAELYRPVRALSPAVVALEPRPEPRRLERRPLGFEVLGESGPVDVPGRVVVRLAHGVPGDHPLIVEYSLAVPTVALRGGAAPSVALSYRQGDEGGAPPEPALSFPLGRGVAAVLGSNPEAIEQRLLFDKRQEPSQLFDTIVFDFASIGLLSPKSIRFDVTAVTEVVPADVAASPDDAAACHDSRNLLEDFDDGRALVRDFQPAREPRGFWISANRVGEHVAEVTFRVRPCRDGCFHAELRVKEGAGDGVDLEAHLLDGSERKLLYDQRWLAGAGPESFELPLYAWSGRDVALRLGLRPGEDVADDKMLIDAPRIARCSGRTSLADAMRQGEARVVAGRAWADGENVLFAIPGARVAHPLTVFGDTCLVGTARLEGELAPTAPDVAAQLSLHLELDGVRHRSSKLSVHWGQETTLPQHSLHDFIGRRATLWVSADIPDSLGDVRVALSGLRPTGCPRP